MNGLSPGRRPTTGRRSTPGRPLAPGRRLALAAGIAALVAGIVAVVGAGGGVGGAAHRLPAASDASLRVAGTLPVRPGQGGAADQREAPAPRANPGGTASGRVKSGTGGPRAGHPALLQVAARYLGVAPSTVRREVAAGQTLGQIADARPGRSVAGLVQTLVAARTAAIRAAAAEGRITGLLEARRLSRVRKVIAAAVARGRLGAPAAVAVALRPAARYLGVDLRRLRSEMRRGQTLAQIADATPGRSANGLVDALVAARQAALDRLVKSGQVKQQRELVLVATYRARLTARIRQRST